MTHDQSLQTHAAERYLLGEMSDIEQHRFEDHYFSCEECAESVRLGATLAGNARAAFAQETAVRPEPRRSWLDWLRVPVLAPSLAAAVLACVVGYQAMVQIPSLKNAYSAQAIDPVALRPISRGAEMVVPVSAGPGLFSVAVLLPSEAQGGPVSYTLSDASGQQIASGSAPAPAPGRSLILLFRNDSVRPGNGYNLHVLQPGRDLGEFPFTAVAK